MVENIEIKPRELKQLLLDYYKNETKDESVKITFTTREELVGFYESKCVVTRVKLRQNMSLGSQVISKEREISEEELKDVLNEMLIQKDYEVINLFLDNEKQYIGYYEDSSYSFGGVRLDVRKIQKQKVR